jgi:hypothetical protein
MRMGKFLVLFLGCGCKSCPIPGQGPSRSDAAPLKSSPAQVPWRHRVEGPTTFPCVLTKERVSCMAVYP